MARKTVVLDDVTEGLIRRALNLKETEGVPKWVLPAYQGVKMFWERMGGGSPGIQLALLTLVTGRLILRQKTQNRYAHAPRNDLPPAPDLSWVKYSTPGMRVLVRIGRYDCEGILLAVIDDRRADVKLLRTGRSRVFRLKKIRPKPRREHSDERRD